jgi:acetyl esterase/lipase
LLDSGLSASRIAIAGESTGAGLALATLVALKDAGLEQPSSALLMSAWVDLTLSGDSIAAKRLALSMVGESRREPTAPQHAWISSDAGRGRLPWVLVLSVQGMEAAAFSAVRAELVSLHRGS